MVMNFQVLYNIWNFLSSCATGGFSRTAQLCEVNYLGSWILMIRQKKHTLKKEKSPNNEYFFYGLIILKGSIIKRSLCANITFLKMENWNYKTQTYLKLTLTPKTVMNKLKQYPKLINYSILT
jgi:hypothetical protein